ncbi:MAG: hypothetical protein KJ737_04430 [Proteobacteria bacterium]|nr:hypothetical protein [Pseudomonadota bacterium]
MNINISYKFLLSDNGILFLLADDQVNSQKELQLTFIGEDFYLKIDNIFSLLNDAIINHLRELSENQEFVNLAWYHSTINEYEIRFLFAKALSRVECSKLVVMHDLKKKGLLGNNQNPKVDEIKNENELLALGQTN